MKRWVNVVFVVVAIMATALAWSGITVSMLVHGVRAGLLQHFGR